MSHSTATTAPLRASTQVPDAEGRFGEFGRRFVPETLMHALEELTVEYEKARRDPAFEAELNGLLKTFVGRPSPLHFAERLTKHCGGARIYLKREDLNHTGAHKINNTIGQGLLTLRMGKKRVIAETGAGQHGVATATACARFGLDCVVYMGEEDIRRQRLNVFNMRMLGAEVRPVTTGSRTLRDAINEAMRDWMASVADTHYILGIVVGPHPFPMIVRDFQSVIGRETRKQCLEELGRLPDEVVACVGGGSNSAGMFYPFVEDEEVALTGVEAGGRGPAPGRTRQHALVRSEGRAARQLQLRAAGRRRADARRPLDFGRPRLSRRRPRAQLLERHRPRAVRQRDRQRGARSLPDAGSARGHFAGLGKLARDCPSHAKRPARGIRDDVVVVCLSGRGDKDVYEVARLLGKEV